MGPFFPPHVEEVINDAAKEAFDNNEPMFCHEGGSIPFMGKLTKIFPKSYFMVTGLLGPASNAHGPNESLDIPMLKKLFHAMCRFTEKAAKLKWSSLEEEKRQRIQS